MLRVVNLHRLGIDVRNQRIVGIGQGWQRKGHNVSPKVDRAYGDLATTVDARLATPILGRQPVGCKEVAS